MTAQPAKLMDAAVAFVAPTPTLRNVACERKAVTAEMRAIGLWPHGKQMLLHQVSASRALGLLKQFRQGYCQDLTCKRGSVGQSEGLLIPRSSVRFRLNPEN